MTQSWATRTRKVSTKLAEGLLQLVYPAVCNVCAQLSPTPFEGICATCRDRLTTDRFEACGRCGATVGPFAARPDGCVSCRGEPFHFEAVHRLGEYDGLLREVILRLKHHSGEMLAEVVGQLWANHADEKLRAVQADVLVPVPLHWWRYLRRGYNQSETLAQQLARKLRLPCRPRWLRRARNTPRQVEQTATGRRANVRDAFRAREGPGLLDKTVLLVDDVVTSGSTASDAARALRAAGAARVVVAALATARSQRFGLG